MRYPLLTLTALCLLLTACGKDAQYSTWTVNGEGFSTNQTEVMEAYRQGVSGLSGGELENRFSIDFNFGELPASGNFAIRYWAVAKHTYDEAYVGFFYKGQPYVSRHPDSSYLQASQANGKASYYIPPTWFIGRNDDSVLIEGTFKEP